MESTVKRLQDTLAYTAIFNGSSKMKTQFGRLKRICHGSFSNLVLMLIILSPLVLCVSQVSAQDTVSGGSFLNAEELTEISQSGTLDLFDSNLGTLTSVEISFRGVGTTEIELVNNGATNASVSQLATEMQLLFQSTDTDINNVFGPIGSGFPPILDVSFQVPGLSAFTPLIIEPDETYLSGDIVEDEVQTATFTDATDLLAFQQAGGGTFDLTCVSLTQISRTSSGGNLSESQITNAGCGMEITYTYEPNTNITITEGPCWRTIASPEEQSYADFFAAFETNGADYGGLWTQGSGITGARASFGGPNVFTLNADGSDWVAVSDLTQTMPAGTGVLISVFEEDEYENPSSSGFPKVAEFTGTGSPVNFNLGTLNGTTGANGGTSTGDGGFSMLGNPFNTAIDFNALFNDNTTGIRQAAWVYDRNADGGSGGWISTNEAGLGDLTDGIIAAGQGFVVQNIASPGTPSVDFQEAVKIPKTGTFYGKRAEKPDHLRIEIRGENVYNSAWIQLSENGSVYESNNGDVVQFYPFESEYAVLSTVKQGKMMDIGHFPYPGEELSIPLTVETTSTKPMTLSLTDIQVGTAMPLYLHDTVTGESIELTSGAEYTFIPNGTPVKAITGCLSAPVGLTGPMEKSQNTAPRFLINTDASINGGETEQPSAFSLDQNYPNPFNPTTQITYQLPQQSQVTLSVYDMAGRQVATLVNENVIAGTHTVDFNASSLSSGVYMYRLQAGSTVLTKKLTLVK